MLITSFLRICEKNEILTLKSAYPGLMECQIKYLNYIIVHVTVVNTIDQKSFVCVTSSELFPALEIYRALSTLKFFFLFH